MSVLREIDYRDSRVAEIQKLNRKQRRRSEHDEFHEIPADSILRDEELPTSEETLSNYDDSGTAVSITFEDNSALDMDILEEVEEEGSELNVNSADCAEDKATVVSQVQIEIPEVEVFDWDELMQNF